MFDYMSIDNSPTKVFTTAESLSGGAFTAVALAASGITTAGASSVAVGLLTGENELPIPEGEDVTVQVTGGGYWITGESISAGDLLTSGAGGVAKKAAGGDFIFAQAMAGGASRLEVNFMEKIFRKTMLYKSGVEYGDYSMNHVLGCAHGCNYPCYAFRNMKRFGMVKDYQDWCQPKLVANTLELLDQEIPRLKGKIKSVQLCFNTDPFMLGFDEVQQMSLAAIKKLNDNGITCSVLTKGILPIKLGFLLKANEIGISLVSLSEDFRKQYEPNSAPYFDRIQALRRLCGAGCKTWVSIEPFPTPNIFKQDLEEIFDDINFVDRVVFGKWNYGRASGFPNWKNFYNAAAQKVIDFCELYGIDCHIKDGTVSKLNLFDRNGCRLKLGDTVRILADECNKYGNFTPDDDAWWEFNETGVVRLNSRTNLFELVSENCLEYCYWELERNFPDGMKISFLEVIKEVNH